MKRFLAVLFFLSPIFFSCDREIEVPNSNSGFSFFPFLIGNYWIYEVDERIYFGENDFEDRSFYYRDLIRTVYVDDAGEQVFIVQRDWSSDQESWTFETEYTLVVRGQNLIMNLNNSPIVVLAFPIQDGLMWDGNRFRDAVRDDFQIELETPISSENVRLKVIQEEADDLITFRDKRYDVFEENVGLIERYYEVLTYCSRNDCLGDQLIDSGKFVHMRLIRSGNE
ncbi:MAG: hypothetical protein HWE15_07125 [Algoriphagus sp.]|uniref:hypothetical protein n=1 Tax=Algoriphagus sp. TaxID=1872435 RepID=UPI001817AB0F|nr:hypothetical protein [Algoriphagus sp.]NVJ86060.1 hypothetical protein [Algoriphagus sp.]